MSLRSSSPEPLPRAERGWFHRTPRPYGRSRLGAPLQVFEAEAGPSQILVCAGTHGDEGEGVTVLSAALRSVPAGALATHVVLAVNPDGLARGTRGNAVGVDLNRNFPSTAWAAEDTFHRWTVDAPRDVRLRSGSAPASEPETRALLDLVTALQPAIVVSLHAPLAVIDDPAGSTLGRWLAQRTGLPLVEDVGYPTPGSLGTWGAEVGLPIITYELPDQARETLVRQHAPILYELLVGTAPP